MPNGALCFTNKDSSTIGRITTSGVDAEMPGERDHGQQPPSDHAAPEGNDSDSNTIGSITPP